VEATVTLIAMCYCNRWLAVSVRSARPFGAGQGAQDTSKTGSCRSDGGGDASGVCGSGARWSEAVRLDSPRRSTLPSLAARGKELKAR
jgi:hypothetical protein